MDRQTSLIGIVEDEPTVRRALGRMIESLGFKVKLFASASDYMNKSDPDPKCLILDLVMPGMNGLELLAGLQGTHRSVPTVIISAHDNQVYRGKARLLGVIAYLRKPCDENTLLDAIEKSLASNDAPRS